MVSEYTPLLSLKEFYKEYFSNTTTQFHTEVDYSIYLERFKKNTHLEIQDYAFLENRIKSSQTDKVSFFQKDLLPFLFPSHCIEKKLFFITEPFNYSNVLLSPSLKKRISNPHWHVDEVKKFRHAHANTTELNALNLILNRLYHQNISFNTDKVIKLKDVKNNLIKFYRIIDNYEYVTISSHASTRKEIILNIEDLTLDKMQGADGLRALRVEVNLEYKNG